MMSRITLSLRRNALSNTDADDIDIYLFPAAVKTPACHESNLPSNKRDIEGGKFKLWSGSKSTDANHDGRNLSSFGLAVPAQPERAMLTNRDTYELRILRPSKCLQS